MILYKSKQAVTMPIEASHKRDKKEKKNTR